MNLSKQSETIVRPAAGRLNAAIRQAGVKNRALDDRRRQGRTSYRFAQRVRVEERRGKNKRPAEPALQAAFV
jgi:hypothetical protein